MELVTSTATGSCSSLSSMSSSSSSFLNLSKLEDESNMNSTTIISPGHSHTPTKKRCQQDEERFFFVGESDEGDELEHHFFDSCFLCKKPISHDHEIFMYRGDEAFCSERCRIEQMEMDEALETVERRQCLKTKSSVSHSTSNYVGRNSSEEKQEKSIFSIQKRPTVVNLTACGLLNLQNFGFATHVAFMEP